MRCAVIIGKAKVATGARARARTLVAEERRRHDVLALGAQPRAARRNDFPLLPSLSLCWGEVLAMVYHLHVRRSLLRTHSRDIWNAIAWRNSWAAAPRARCTP